MLVSGLLNILAILQFLKIFNYIAFVFILIDMNKLFVFSLASFCLFLTAKSQIVERRLPVGDAVNSAFKESNARMTPDKSRLYFVREGHPQNTRINEEKFCQDIWYSDWSSDNNTWLPAVKMSDPFNRHTYNAIVYIAPDGKELIIRGAYKEGKWFENGFSTSFFDGVSWSVPERIVIDEYASMVKGLYDGAAFSMDKKMAIFFFSEKANAIHSDLYVSFLKMDGSYTRPVKLKILSSPDDEITPYISNDGKLLYFSSDRAGGSGNYDLYVSRRLDESWLNWGSPLNLGSSFNTIGFEAGFSSSSDETMAFYTSSYSSMGESDLVSVALYKEPQPVKNVMLTVRVKDDSGKALRSYLYVNDLDNKVQNTFFSDSGVFISLFNKSTHVFRAEADSYVEFIDTLDVNELGNELLIAIKRIPEPVMRVSIALNSIAADNKMPIPVKAWFHTPGYDSVFINSDGNTVLSLLPGLSYNFALSAKNYIPVLRSFFTPDSASDMKLDIVLEPIVLGKGFRLDKLYFDNGKASIRPESFKELDYLLQTMIENPTMKIQISGYTDNVGSDALNNQLSYDRAFAVSQYLIYRSISSTRIITKGMGKKNPVGNNANEAGRQLNRRVEFIIIQK